MNYPDAINGSLEAVASAFICLSIRKIWVDREVKGVSIPHITFYALWGWWNVIWYPWLGQWLSFYGGVLVVITNMIWIAMMVWFKYVQPKPKDLAR